MLKVLAELLMSGEVTFESGEIHILRSKFILVPADFLVALTKKTAEDTKQAKFFYETTKTIARDSFMKEVCKKYGVGKKKSIDLAKSLAELGGYGRFDYFDFDDKNTRGIIHFYNSTIGSALKGQSNKPVDHLIRGIAAGFFEAAYPGNNIECIETRCIAIGDPHCEFILKKRSDFETEHSQLIEDQLPLGDAEKR